MSDTKALHIAHKCTDLTFPCSWAQLCRELDVDLSDYKSVLISNWKGYHYSRLSEHYAIEIELSIFDPQQTDRDKEVTGADVVNYHVIGRR